MSLDITVLNDNGRPGVSVAINEGQHFALLQIAKRLSLPLVQRLKDYYEDATFTREEVDALIHELDLLSTQNSCEPALINLINSLNSLARSARDGKSGIHAVAD